mgnify:FL=1
MGVRIFFKTTMNKEPMNLTNLRANLYQIVDEIIETGEPIAVLRNGYKLELKLEQQQKKSLFERFEGHPNLIAPGVTDEELIHTPWEWNIDENTAIKFNESIS